MGKYGTFHVSAMDGGEGGPMMVCVFSMRKAQGFIPVKVKVFVAHQSGSWSPRRPILSRKFCDRIWEAGAAVPFCRGSN